VTPGGGDGGLGDRHGGGTRNAIVRRLVALPPTFIGITLLTFAGLHLVPGDPIDAASGGVAAGEGAAARTLSPESRAELRRAYGLNRPLATQYADWVSRLVRLDLGRSFHDGRPVKNKIAERLPTTLTLTFLAALLAYLVAVPLGTAAAARAGSRFDRGLGASLWLAAATPPYWAASLAIVFLGGGAYLDWFPVLGLASDGSESWPLAARLADRAWHLVLPVGCLSIGAVASVSRVCRAAVVDALAQDYVRTARAKGAGAARVLVRHGLRTALLPLVTLASALLPSLLGGSIVVETIFGIPGMGLLGYEAMVARDYPVILAVTSLAAMVTMLGMAAADVVYRLVDPRVTFEGTGLP